MYGPQFSAGAEFDRKVLAEIAYLDEQGFADLAEIAKKAR